MKSTVEINVDYHDEGLNEHVNDAVFEVEYDVAGHGREQETEIIAVREDGEVVDFEALGFSYDDILEKAEVALAEEHEDYMIHGLEARSKRRAASRATGNRRLFIEESL